MKPWGGGGRTRGGSRLAAVDLRQSMGSKKNVGAEVDARAPSSRGPPPPRHRVRQAPRAVSYESAQLHNICHERVSAKQTVSFDAIRAALRGLARARLDGSDVKLDGPLAGRVFYMRPRSTDPVNHGRVTNAVHEARRRSDGSWAVLQAELPNGGQVPLFVDRDRSWAQRRKGYAVARAADALRSVVDDHRVKAAKAAGTLVLDWMEVVSVAYDDDQKEAVASWDVAKIDAAGVDSSAVLAAFNAAIAAAARSARRG